MELLRLGRGTPAGRTTRGERNIRGVSRQMIVNGDCTDTSHPMRSMSYQKHIQNWAPEPMRGGRVPQMNRLILGVALACAASGMTLGAQPPGGRMGAGPMPGPGDMGRRGGGGAAEDPAQFLLAHTGEFKLRSRADRLTGVARCGHRWIRCVLSVDPAEPARTRPRASGCDSDLSRCVPPCSGFATSRRWTGVTPLPC